MSYNCLSFTGRDNERVVIVYHLQAETMQIIAFDRLGQTFLSFITPK